MIPNLIKTSNMDCLICGSDKYRIIGIRPSASFKEYRGQGSEIKIVQCKKCEFYYCKPMPIYEYDSLQSKYGEEYFDKAVQRGIERAERNYYKIQKYIKKPSRILDIGCGQGSFLYYCKLKGHEAEGFDISEYSKQYVEAKYGIRVNCGDFLKLNMAMNSFDFIYCDQVLEHVYEPLLYIKKVHKLLRPDGKVYIGVPNEESLVFYLSNLYFKLTRSQWTANLSPLFPPYHIGGYTPKTLRYILEGARFKVEWMTTNVGSNDGMTAYHPLLAKTRENLLIIADKFNRGVQLEVVASKINDE